MMRCGGRPAMSRPSKRIAPAVGGKVPDKRLKMVLLPEPLGPISPRISPAPTAKETLLTAVKPPNRLTSPSTSSTGAASLLGVGRRFRQLQYRLALLLLLGPDHIGLVVDILHDDRIGAVVLASHLVARLLELDAKAEHRLAVAEIGVERRLAQIVGGDAAILLDRARQDIVQEQVGVRRRH